MAKRALCLLLAVLMMCSLAAPAYAEEAEEPALQTEEALEPAPAEKEPEPAAAPVPEPEEEEPPEAEPSAEPTEEPADEPAAEPSDAPVEEPSQEPAETEEPEETEDAPAETDMGVAPIAAENVTLHVTGENADALVTSLAVKQADIWDVDLAAILESAPNDELTGLADGGVIAAGGSLVILKDCYKIDDNERVRFLGMFAGRDSKPYAMYIVTPGAEETVDVNITKTDETKVVKVQVSGGDYTDSYRLPLLHIVPQGSGMGTELQYVYGQRVREKNETSDYDIELFYTAATEKETYSLEVAGGQTVEPEEAEGLTHVKVKIDDDASALQVTLGAEKIPDPTVSAMTGAEAASKGIKLTWTAAEGAVKYRVYYKNGSKWTKIADTAGTKGEDGSISYTWKNASNNKTYTFAVRGLNSKGKFVGGYSDPTIQFRRLSTPSVTLSSLTKGIKVSWKPITGAERYRVVIKDVTTKETETVLEKDLDPEAVETLDSKGKVTGYAYEYKEDNEDGTPAASGHKYSVTVRVVNEDGLPRSSTSSAKTKTYLAAPVLSAVEADGKYIKLTWSPVDGAVKYRVYYRTSAKGTWKKITDTKGTANEEEELTYTWKKAKTGTKYYFSVACVNSKGTSVLSAKSAGEDDDNAFTLLPAPSISLSNQTGGLKVSWGAVKNAESYTVTIKAKDKEDVEETVEAPDTSYLYEDAESGVKYTVTVESASGDEHMAGLLSSAKTKTFMAAPKLRESEPIEGAAGGVKIVWKPVDSAVKYRVYYRTSTTGSWTKITDTKGTAESDGSLSYTWKKAKTGKNYYFSVACVDSKGKSVLSAKYDNQDAMVTLLAAPTVTLSNVTDGIKVTWSKVTAAQEYQVIVKNGNVREAKEVVDANAKLQYVFDGAVSGVSYTVTVQAINGSSDCNLGILGSKSITHLKPPAIKEVEGASSGIKLTWDPVPGAVNYRLYYTTDLKDSGTAWTKIADTKGTKAGDSLTYTWTKAAVGTKYWFSAACVDKNGKSVLSAKIEDKDDCLKLLAAPVFTTKLLAKGVRLSWSKVTDAKKYVVALKQADGSWKTLTTTDKTMYDYTEELESGKSYTFTVWCVDDRGKCVSKFSSGKAVKFLAAPEGIEAVNTGTGIMISWDEVDGAVKYRVKYKSDTGDWINLSATDKNYYTWTGGVNGSYYTFTVECVDSKGKTATSDYDPSGVKIKLVKLNTSWYYSSASGFYLADGGEDAKTDIMLLGGTKSEISLETAFDSQVKLKFKATGYTAVEDGVYEYQGVAGYADDMTLIYDQNAGTFTVSGDEGETEYAPMEKYGSSYSLPSFDRSWYLEGGESAKFWGGKSGLIPLTFQEEGNAIRPVVDGKFAASAFNPESYMGAACDGVYYKATMGPVIAPGATGTEEPVALGEMYYYPALRAVILDDGSGPVLYIHDNK